MLYTVEDTYTANQDIRRQPQIIDNTIVFDNKTADLEFVSIHRKEIKQIIFKTPQNLKYLDISWCEVEKIIFSENCCPKLKSLYLQHNNLKEIDFNVQLPELQLLDLIFNKNLQEIKVNNINTILPNLKYFYVYECDLRNLSAFADFFIKNDVDFNIKENKNLTNPPEESVKSGNEGIKEWFRQQKKYGKAYFYEAKIIIVGDGGAGKTTLLKKLRNPDFIPTEDELETHGINVEKKKTFDNIKNPAEPISTTIWDFGGQDIQYFLHHYFLSEDALYILVAKTREETRNFKYWFRAINYFGGKKPQILVVYNEIDKPITETNINLDAYKRAYPNSNIDFVVLDFKYNDHRWQRFNELLKEKLAKLPTVGKEGNVAWKTVKDELNKISKPYIKKEDFDNIAIQKAKMDKKDITGMLKHFRLTGFVLYYGILNDEYENDSRRIEEQLLNDFVFLDPKWLTDALYAPIAKRDEDKSIQFKELVPIKWLEDYWKNEGYVDEDIKIFISLLQENYFDVAFRINKKTLFVPKLVGKGRPEFDWYEIEGEETIIFLDFGTFLPDGILTRFMVRANKYIKIKNNKLLIGNQAVILEDGDAVALVELDVAKTEQINIKIKNDTLGKLKGFILNTFETIFDDAELKDFQRPEIKIPCTCDKCKPLFEKGQINRITLFSFDEIEIAKKEGRDLYCNKGGKFINVDKLYFGFEKISRSEIKTQSLHETKDKNNEEEKKKELRRKIRLTAFFIIGILVFLTAIAFVLKYFFKSWYAFIGTYVVFVFGLLSFFNKILDAMNKILDISKKWHKRE